MKSRRIALRAVIMACETHVSSLRIARLRVHDDGQSINWPFPNHFDRSIYL